MSDSPTKSKTTANNHTAQAARPGPFSLAISTAASCSVARRSELVKLSSRGRERAVTFKDLQKLPHRRGSIYLATTETQLREPLGRNLTDENCLNTGFTQRPFEVSALIRADHNQRNYRGRWAADEPRQKTVDLFGGVDQDRRDGGERAAVGRTFERDVLRRKKLV